MVTDGPAIRLQVHSRSYIVIPARLASTRLPGKLLLSETGKPLLQHTYEAALAADRPTGVCVAADHERIANAVRAFGGEVYLTDPNAQSGTDRVAEIARRMSDVDIFVNVQGDEPEISGSAIDATIELLASDPSASMATLATPIRSRDQLLDPACVKVVVGNKDQALYFSRSPIPCARDWDDSLLTTGRPHFLQHVGLYAYRRDFLLQYPQLPASDLEQLEKLEQLRAISAGHQILVAMVDEPTIGIDTPADYRAFVSRTKNW
jgi:3-deoxy-manno-octulosonate cytidylyltransferase (CMP-KDO synthetase)